MSSQITATSAQKSLSKYKKLTTFFIRGDDSKYNIDSQLTITTSILVSTTRYHSGRQLNKYTLRLNTVCHYEMMMMIMIMIIMTI